MGPIRNPRWEQKRTEGYVIVSTFPLPGRSQIQTPEHGHTEFPHCMLLFDKSNKRSNQIETAVIKI
jgi:hypothetical protein